MIFIDIQSDTPRFLFDVRIQNCFSTVWATDLLVSPVLCALLCTIETLYVLSNENESMFKRLIQQYWRKTSKQYVKLTTSFVQRFLNY